jgi:iron(II)-dependent oxidoreductase
MLERVPDEFLRVRVHDFYSPVGWHFGHVGRTEEFWTVGEALGQPLLDDQLTFIFADRADNPKDNRVNIPDRAGLIDYLQRTRESVLGALDQADLDADDPILADGYAWEFAIQHECQHQETIAEMLQLIQRQRPQEPVEGLTWRSSVPWHFVEHRGGEFVMGSDDPFGYDNEKREHTVKAAPLSLAAFPVTAYQWTEFIADRGYSRAELWSEAGEAWREAGNVSMPEHWVNQVDGSWATHGPLGLRALHPDEPVCGISAHEADAFARWAGKRLPTEEEWEYAASAGRYPWGDEEPTPSHANYGLSAWGPTPVNRHPLGGLPNGLQDLAGNVWEWTSSAFLPYPGFEAYPYDGYSKDHMKGAHRVCRGGSWATSATILRRSFRNWYVPTYRQGFLGLRLAS